MDLASETLARPPGNDSLPETPACSCALHEPRQDSDQIVGGYLSFSSFSEAWLACARHYGQHAVRRFNLGPGSVVLEFAGSAENPSPSSAGVRFGHKPALRLAAQGQSADLVIAGTVLAQAPDPDDLAAGFAAILKPDGILILECPRSSLSAVEFLLGHYGLKVFDLDEPRKPDGSLRLFCCLAGSARLRQARRAAAPAR